MSASTMTATARYRRSASPDDALGSTAKFLLNRGKYHRGEHWGYEVRGAGGGASGSRSYAAWSSSGVTRADGEAFAQPNATAQMWIPVPGGPTFLLGPNFYAVEELQSVDELCAGDLPSRRPHPRRTALHPALPWFGARADIGRSAGDATRLTKAGFDTGGNDGRVGNDTMKAIRDYQVKNGSAAGRWLWRAESAGALEAGFVTADEINE